MARLKSDLPRKSGLSFIGDVAWGTHLCQFYQTKADLLDILVPYFRAGLENNEFCMWVTAEPLDASEAKKAMEEAMRDFSRYLKRGQIEIISYKDWYLKDGVFDSDRVLSGWVSKLEQAVEKGFAGLRLTGNTFWLEKKDWKAFTDYEEAVNNVIGRFRMIAICTYSLDKCNANEILDAIKNHQFALIKRRGKWEVIESAEQKRIAEDLRETERKFAALYDSMTEGVVLHDIVYNASGKAVDYIITDVNPSFERITGLSKKQAVGKKASELYGTGEPPYLEIFAEVASSGKPTSFETYFPPMQKHFSISVVSPSKGRFNTIFHDITASKKTEEALRASEQRWATTLESIGDAVIATDLDGNVTFMNAVAEKLTGWKLKEASQKPIKKVFNIINEETRLQVENPVARVLEKGAVVGLANHTVLVRKDGTEVAIDDSGAPIRDENGKVIGVVLVFRDITERKKTEQALINAKTEWERTFDSVPDLIAILDSQHRIVRANRAMAQRLGTTPDRCVGLTCYKCVHDTSFPPEFCPHVQTLMDGKEHIAEVHEDRLGGDFVVSTTPLIDETGHMVGSVHMARDITERKRIENELRETRDYLENLLNYANAPIIVWDTDFRITKFNHAFERLTGLSSTDAVGKNLDILFPLDKKEESMAHIKRTLEGEYWETVEIPILNTDGTVKTLLWNSANIYGPDGARIVATIAQGHDITERKKALEALRESQQDLNRAQAVAKTGSWRLDIHRNVLLWSDETYRIFGIPKGTALTYETFLNAVHPDDRNYVDEKWKAGIRSGDYNIEHRIIVNGEIKWVREKAEMEFDDKGVLVAGFGTAQDITERKKAEEALLRSEEKERARAEELKTILDAVPAAVWIANDPESLQIAGNRPSYDILRLPEGANASMSAPEGQHPTNYRVLKNGRELKPHEMPVQLAAKGKVLQDYEFAIEFTDGVVRYLLGNACPLYDTEGKLRGSVAAFIDITERKEMQDKLEDYSKHLENLVEEKTKQLRDAERLSAIGETAGMVGHDIRNPLQAIIGELYLAKGELDSLPDGEPKNNLKDTVTEIEEQVTYINKIVTDLQDYAKPSVPCFEEVDVESIIQSVLSVTPVTSTIEVAYSVSKDFPKLLIDPSYMRRILTNLISNAVQAMANGGKLTINACCKDNKALVSVKDTGEGIPEEAKSRMFKPLFTTKAKGQGFGLAVVKKLANALGGNITFESEFGKGTKFTVELPLKP